LRSAGIKIGYDFRSETDVWFARLAPAKGWEVFAQTENLLNSVKSQFIVCFIVELPGACGS
jgi:hypothetical protein